MSNSRERKIDSTVAERFLEKDDFDLLAGITAITDGAAELLSKHKNYLDLSGLTELSDAAARSLSKHKGVLYLSGLTELSDAAAEALSMHRGHLVMNGLTEISASAAKSLSNFCGERIELSLKKLSQPVAESLSKSSCMKLNLDALTKISDSSAKALSKLRGSLSFNTCIPNLSLAVVTELCKIDELSLRISKRNLTSKHVKAIAGFEGSYLALTGFASMPDEFAHELSNFQGKLLRLDEYHKIIPKLSREGARSLCKITNLLVNSSSFGYQLRKKAEIESTDWGVPESTERSPSYIDEEFAQKWIRGGEGVYSVVKATGISDEAALRFGQVADEFQTLQFSNLSELSETAALALAKFGGQLWLDGLKEISDSVVEALSKHEGKKLSLDGITELSDAAAQSLSKHRGELSLCRVGKISKQAATAMLQKPAGTINNKIPAEWVANFSR